MGNYIHNTEPSERDIQKHVDGLVIEYYLAKYVANYQDTVPQDRIDLINRVRYFISDRPMIKGATYHAPSLGEGDYKTVTKWDKDNNIDGRFRQALGIKGA